MKRIYRILLLIVCFSFTYFGSAESVWDGYSYNFSWYTQGFGSTYHIKTAGDLAGLSRCFSQGYYLYGNFAGCTVILDDDIDLAGHEWTPIGQIDASYTYCAFNGVFDGNGHTIKGMKITKTNACPGIKVGGLFGYIPHSDTFSVKNLTVQGTINLNNPIDNDYDILYVGGIVGLCSSSNLIENCKSDVEITVTQTSGNSMNVVCGGIVGQIDERKNAQTLNKCFSKGAIRLSLNNSNRCRVGGIVGSLSCNEMVIEECSSDCIIFTENGQGGVGGILGSGNCDAIRNAMFGGSIEVAYSAYGLVGGIVGMVFSVNTISSCLVTGSISKTFGTSWVSPISGTSGSALVANDCYYLSSIPNNSGYGTAISDEELRSGNELPNFDTSIWCFSQGNYPYLGFTKPRYMLNIGLEGGYLGMIMSEGDTKEFVITCNEDESLYQVLWNGEDITNTIVDGKYLTTPAIYFNTVLTVVYKDTNNSVLAPENSSVKFHAKDGCLRIYNLDKPTRVIIYNKSGMLIKNVMVDGQEIMVDELVHDVYIIKVGEESFKMIL